MNSRNRSLGFGISIGLAGLLLLPFAVGSYAQHVLVVSLYYVVLASSWNLLAGYTGLFSLAHHAFAALGGYTSGMLAVHAGVPVPLGILAGVILAGAAGYGLGALTLRMRAIYLALATWAFAESLRLIIAAEYKFTRGDLGLRVPHLFGTSNPRVHYYIFLALALLTVVAIRALLHSKIGYRLRAIRDDEEAAATTGINTVRWKKFAFAVTSAMAGMAGAFYGHYIGLLSPVSIKFTEMATIIIMVIVGGLRTISGPIVGAVFVEVLSEVLRLSGEVRMVLFALLVIVLMRLYPGGLMAFVRSVARRLRRYTALREVPASWQEKEIS
ncbi:MAG: branched-chain amino acid ABC transporter permease [Armatimonadota bacterium]|nr:branched-chain amino acid ABC transporter permease [Armatimonadota bacterium]MDR5703240.1 branched-chain amino acid ABC transporter permease [Armatimonadota bacterium]MDR7433826.1 branched-chain amino acid ABC transporter permease [Armatimonadota bacterium]